MSDEIQLYLEHARRDLEAAEGNLKLGFYHIYRFSFLLCDAICGERFVGKQGHNAKQTLWGYFGVW